MDSLTSDFLAKVKQNKKYKTIADEIVIEEIKKYLANNNINKISKKEISLIRKNLHLSYSSFQIHHKKDIQKYLEELKLSPRNLVLINKLLSTTLSTKERLPFYNDLYKKIFEITGIPKTIIELGSGFNPFSYSLMGLKKLNLYAYDIDEKDIELLNKYFEIMKDQGLNAKAEILDIRNIEKIKDIPNSDIIFLFKVIDILDINNHKPSEELIKILSKKTKFIIASFATKTITRKKMNHAERKWFELMLSRLNFKFQEFKIENEIFYVIKNDSF